MKGSRPRRLCLTSRLSGVAGPAGFQRRLAAGLQRRGFEVSYSLDDGGGDAVLVIGATRALGALWRAQRRGVPIVQRLDGMNWIHRRRPTGWRHYLRAEVNNWLLRLIRGRFADVVVYQSIFARRWWEARHGPARAPSTVIHNGVELDRFTPDGARWPAGPGRRVVVLEGSIGGGYEVGLLWAVDLAARLAATAGSEVELAVAGAIRDRLPDLPSGAGVRLAWLGLVEPTRVPELLRSGDLLFSADLHPACPNSVIEALACGLPVVAFDTGALTEIVDGESGAVVAYGGDPWRIDPPDVPALARAARTVIDGGERYRRGARRRAEGAFGAERMVDEYLAVLGW